jgi:ferredoxin-like protein FixX
MELMFGTYLFPHRDSLFVTTVLRKLDIQVIIIFPKSGQSTLYNVITQTFVFTMAVTAIASESATAEGVPESPSFDESRKVVAAVSEESNSVMETSKKRKRPTASLLKHAMEELDSIWINAETDAGDEADTEDDDHGERMATKNHPNRNRHQVPEQELCPADLFRVRQTSSLLVKVLTQDIHEPAIRALVENEELKASQMKLKTELESSQKEVERLRRSEQRSKEAIKVCPNICYLLLCAQ